MVNRGEEKVRVHMNVVPRSTGNTNCVPSATRHNIQIYPLFRTSVTLSVSEGISHFDVS